MIWLFILAGLMAVFGVIGYLRGTKAALVILLAAQLAVAVTGILGDTIVKYINAFGKGFNFLLSGGLNALAGEGGVEEAVAALQDAPALVTDQNRGLVLGLLFMAVLLLGLAISAIPWFKGPRSVFGLLLGLVTGYIVAAMVVRALFPECATCVPLPFGFGPPVPVVPYVAQPGAGASIGQRILGFLNSLVDRGLIAAFLGILIAVFLLLAVGTGNRSSRRSEKG